MDTKTRRNKEIAEARGWTDVRCVPRFKDDMAILANLTDEKVLIGIPPGAEWWDERLVPDFLTEEARR